MSGNLAQKVETNLVQWNDNQDWLGSADGVDSCRTVSLDGAAVRAVFPTGVIPSGTPIGELESGLYGPGDPDAGPPAKTGAGHILFTKDVGAAAPAAPAQDTWPCALFEDGRVVTANLPAGGPAFDKAARKQINYV